MRSVLVFLLTMYMNIAFLVLLLVKLVINFFYNVELDYSNNSFNKVLFCLLDVTTSVLDAILVLSLVKLF